MEFLAALYETPVSYYIRESDWGHPVLLCFHAIGMALVVGVVLMTNLRVLGFAAGAPLAAFERLLGLAWAGFVMNALSGALLFAANAPKLITNWTFDLKLALILAGGLSVWMSWRLIHARAALDLADQPTTARQKGLAIASSLFWIGAIVSGRLIAYTLAVG